MLFAASNQFRLWPWHTYFVFLFREWSRMAGAPPLHLALSMQAQIAYSGEQTVPSPVLPMLFVPKLRGGLHLRPDRSLEYSVWRCRHDTIWCCSLARLTGLC